MSLKDEFRKFIHPYDEEDEPEEYQEEERPERPRRDEERRSDDRRSKVVNINSAGQLKVVLMKPVKFDEDANTIADHLMEKRTVVMNMENTDPDIARRLRVRRGLRHQRQRQARGGQDLYRHPLFGGPDGGPDRRTGKQRPVYVTDRERIRRDRACTHPRKFPKKPFPSPPA